MDYLIKMTFGTFQGLKTFEKILREVLTLSSMVQTSDSYAQRIITWLNYYDTRRAF